MEVSKPENSGPEEEDPHETGEEESLNLFVDGEVTGSSEEESEEEPLGVLCLLTLFLLGARGRGSLPPVGVGSTGEGGEDGTAVPLAVEVVGEGSPRIFSTTERRTSEVKFGGREATMSRTV